MNVDDEKLWMAVHSARIMACERSIREALLVKKMEMDEMIESDQSEFTAALRELQREQRAKAKERLLDELRERLETALTAIGEDVYAEHDVLRFSREYGGVRAGVYTYAAIKCDGRWYLTGRYGERWPNGITWDELREFVSAGLVEYPDGTTVPELLITAQRAD